MSNREIVLIGLSGEDRPGVTSSIAQGLADFGANILDIGQSVIHNNLNLGILAEVSDTAESAPVIKEIRKRAGQLDMQVNLEPVSASRYRDWVEAQGKPRHIVTLLSRKLSGEQIARLAQVVASHGLNIDKINRLSGRVPLGEMPENSKSCVEFSLRGELQDELQVRNDLLHLSNELEVDIAYQEDNLFRRHRRLAVFDMDSTLINAEVIDELAKAAGVGEQVAEITESAMRGEIDFTESFQRRVALLEGLDESVLANIAENLELNEGAERLTQTLNKVGYKTAILSGGFEYFAKFLQKKLGFDYVYANQLEIIDGKVTGRVTGTVVDGNRKAELLREIAEKEGLSLEQVVAVGDGANDLPMLSIAGLGIAFRAKPIVRENARQSISRLGLDAILYLMGISDREV